jgi:hypothetical protein
MQISDYLSEDNMRAMPCDRLYCCDCFKKGIENYFLGDMTMEKRLARKVDLLRHRISFHATHTTQLQPKD